MLVLSIASLSSCKEGILFRARALLISHCTPALRLLSTIYLTGISFSFAFIIYERVISPAERVIVVATTHHSRTNDLTTSKALQWAIR